MIVEPCQSIPHSVVYHSDSLICEYVPELEMLYCDWLGCNDMEETLFCATIKEFVELLQKYRPKRILDNSQKVNYPIPPEWQVWLAELVTPVFATIGLQKYALLIPDDWLAELSNEQILAEISELQMQDSFVTHTFYQEILAINWLQKS